MPVPRPQPGQLKWWVIGALGIGGGIALAVWFGLAATLGQPSWQTYGYSVVDDQSVKVTFDVTRPDGLPLTCTVQAMARDFSTVGRVDAAIPQSDTETTLAGQLVELSLEAVVGLLREEAGSCIGHGRTPRCPAWGCTDGRPRGALRGRLENLKGPTCVVTRDRSRPG